MALRELTEMLELADVPVTRKTSTILAIPIGMTTVGYATNPALPPSLIQLENVYESSQATSGFNRITPLDSIPGYLLGTINSSFGVFAWKDNFINLPESNRLNYLMIEYIGSLFGNLVDENSVIGINNGESFLHYRTAGLCAQFIGENKERADELNSDAVAAYDRTMGIETKARQTQFTRRRPFRSSWSHR
jgi:hypothetical protein